MPADRSMWASSFRDKFPPWQCPSCKKGHFVPVAEKMWKQETGPSKIAHADESWEPDWIQNRFTCFMECSFPDCKDIAVVSGTSGLQFFQVDWDEYIQEEIFTVESIIPAPIPIRFPDETPDDIAGAIQRASCLIWLSPEAAANSIRQSVEHLMDQAQIRAKDEAGRRIMLHHRIIDYNSVDSENGDVLLATKWLGNTGSHVDGITRDHVLDAFDMIEFVLNNRFGTARRALMEKVAAVNAAKGPV